MKKLLTHSFFLFCQLSVTASQITFIDEVYEEAYDSGSIIGYYNEKVYLNYSKLIFDGEDWLLDLNEEHYALLPSIGLDSVGYFIGYSDNEWGPSIINCGGYVDVDNTCPDCKEKYFFKCDTKRCVEKREATVKKYKEDKKKKGDEYKEKKHKESEAEKARKKEQKEQAKRTKEAKKKAKKEKST